VKLEQSGVADKPEIKKNKKKKHAAIISYADRCLLSSLWLLKKSCQIVKCSLIHLSRIFMQATFDLDERNSCL